MGTLTRGEVLLFVLTVLAAFVTGMVVAVPGYWGATREMDVKMVEIAVGILSRDPEPGIAPAREWAVDVISTYSDVKPSEAVRNALIENRAVSPSYVSGVSYSYSYPATPLPPETKVPAGEAAQ